MGHSRRMTPVVSTPSQLWTGIDINSGSGVEKAQLLGLFVDP